MRTEYERSYMESGKSESEGCRFCVRASPSPVRKVEYSRDGLQTYTIAACATCRRQLAAHLLSND